VLALALAAAALCAGAADPQSPPPAGENKRSARGKESGWVERPSRDWRFGPVRYFITRNEDKAFKKLGTDEERAEFIERFWARRDPSPGTPVNEFRSDVHLRVAAANQLFKDSPVPGWKTDRGKIYVLLGPPDEVINDTVAREHRGTILWTYRGTGRLGVDPQTVIAFARDTSGEFVMTVRPTDVANPNKGLDPHTPNFGLEAWLYGDNPQNNPLHPAYRAPGSIDPLLRSRGVYSGSSDLSLLGDLTKVQLPNYEVLNEVVVTRTFFGRVPLQVRVDYFKATGERTFLTLTLAVRSSAVQFRRTPSGGQAPDVVLSARLIGETDPTYSLGLQSPEHFTASPRNSAARYDEPLLWQARLALPPGIYKASFALEDRARGSIATHEVSLEVPDFYDDSLMISSVILADALEPAPEGSDAGLTPYVFGRWRLIPRLEPEVRRRGEAAFYFQVYNARRDPVTDLPNLDVSYRFHVLRDGRFEPLAEAILLTAQTSEVHAYAVPLATFPAGSYLVRIEALDTLAGTSAFREVLFKVVGDTP
jgi:GWxTD domain-containing protein